MPELDKDQALRNLGQRLVEGMKPEDAKRTLLDIVGGEPVFEAIDKIAMDGRRRKRHEKLERPVPKVE